MLEIISIIAVVIGIIVISWILNSEADIIVKIFLIAIIIMALLLLCLYTLNFVLVSGFKERMVSLSGA